MGFGRYQDAIWRGKPYLYHSRLSSALNLKLLNPREVLEPATEAYAEGEYSAIVYGRGPIFVSALAEEMGQETFNEFLRDYYQFHLWGIGTGDAFRQLAEKHCQCDLSTLFQEWVYE